MDLMGIIMMEGVDGELTNLQKPLVWPLVRPVLEERFAEKPRAEWLAILKRAGVPCGPVGSRDAWFHGETVAANQMRIEMEHPKLGTVEMPGVSVKLAATPGSVRHLLQPSDQAAPWASIRKPSAPVDDVAVPAAAPGGPLAGVRVIDLGAVIAGAFSAGVLANLGADVIKVEPHQGDSFRSYGLGFAGYNRGKRSLVIDIKAPEGRELFYDLVRQCDAVVDNYRVGVRERLGIDHATLSAINPRIINCSVSGYGTEGLLSAEPGFDPIMQAASGMMETQGGGEEPVYYQINVNDTASALMAAFGIVAALHARERTGRGQEVLTSLAAQSVLCQSGEVTAYAGSPPPPVGSLDCIGVSALQRLYPCADGEWLCLAGTRPEHFQQVCAALGHPEWAGRMTAEKALLEPRDGQLAENIAAALSGFDRDDALDRLLTRGVPAAPAIRLDQVWTDAWLKANRYLDEYEHPIHGTVTGVRTFGEWSRTGGGFERRAPLLGEHSTEVLREFGIDEGRIESLLAAGVVKQG